MHCSSWAALLRMVGCCICLPLLTSCADYSYSSSRYVKLPLAALRQQPWQSLNADESIKSVSGTLCRHFAATSHRSQSALYFFLMVVLPSDWQLNDVQIKMTKPPKGSIDAMAAMTARMTDELSGKLGQGCSCPREVLPQSNRTHSWFPAEPNGSPWVRMQTWFSLDRRTFRASVKRLEQMSHVIMVFHNDPEIEEAVFGFLVNKPLKGIEIFTGVMSALAVCFSLTIMVMTATYLRSTAVSKSCSGDRSGGPNSRCLNSYCDTGREREQFPPDTGIYMG
ncbi:hypothetical protein BOX15_Mlig013102g3 [Macrostomum lignano]|uniref:Uncharacterized protein n=2 Tax=Macrostomum lignano TaxID=282301 RepID=A0A267EL27_9PLAT|nr:hypothetical protein BOX15_Mlig013102g1 [Macrostomum lignano]PAA92903.1 hypothetical protein BOX15_Mlig013102g3 [Macrostomum lignano]